jgi:hypothetical protein
MKSSDIITSIVGGLAEIEGMEILLRVGLNRGLTREKVDFLAGYHNGDISLQAFPIESMLKSRFPKGNFSTCDDSVRFDIFSVTGGVAIYNPSVMDTRVRNWIQGKNLGGEHRPWATGYWLPEGLCGDLATAEILHDPIDIALGIKKLLTPYPLTLSQAITGLCVEEIRSKVSVLKKHINQTRSIEHILCVSDIAAAMVRLAFARSRIFLRGFRSLDDQAKLLNNSDIPTYQLATELSERKRLLELIDGIEKFVDF